MTIGETNFFSPWVFTFYITAILTSTNIPEHVEEKKKGNAFLLMIMQMLNKLSN